MYLLSRIHSELRSVGRRHAAERQVGRERFLRVGAGQADLAGQRGKRDFGFRHEQAVVHLALEISEGRKVWVSRELWKRAKVELPVTADGSVVLADRFLKLHAAPHARCEVRLADVAQGADATSRGRLHDDSIVDFHGGRRFWKNKTRRWNRLEAERGEGNNLFQMVLWMCCWRCKLAMWCQSGQAMSSTGSSCPCSTTRRASSTIPTAREWGASGARRFPSSARIESSACRKRHRRSCLKVQAWKTWSGRVKRSQTFGLV